MVADHKKRETNHKELLACLKEVNQIIQQASRLRVGTFKSQVGVCEVDDVQAFMACDKCRGVQQRNTVCANRQGALLPQHTQH